MAPTSKITANPERVGTETNNAGLGTAGIIGILERASVTKAAVFPEETKPSRSPCCNASNPRAIEDRFLRTAANKESSIETKSSAVTIRTERDSGEFINWW
ncbi:Uncharacterised protein [Chlamydia trachomatis]|nr:Uncharacterised protein [Chlamydia trachomatis]CRH74826.1 Uncharacterised protein [Chlamydia trachomatis]CRI74704.1 Uncharacterised protein [Chlamydia trachomatis]